MRPSVLFAPLAAAVLSTACAATPPIANAPGTGGQCKAEPAQSFIGQVAGAEVIAQAKTAAGANVVQVLKADAIVTMEHRPDRLRIIVDDKNVIISISCT